MLLETGSAQDRPALGRLEGHCCGGAAFRTRSPGFRANPRAAAGAFRLALLAALGVVDELLVVEEELLTCGEHKFCTAIDALEVSICEFHGRLPARREIR